MTACNVFCNLFPSLYVAPPPYFFFLSLSCSYFICISDFATALNHIWQRRIDNCLFRYIPSNCDYFGHRNTECQEMCKIISMVSIQWVGLFGLLKRLQSFTSRRFGCNVLMIMLPTWSEDTPIGEFLPGLIFRTPIPTHLWTTTPQDAHP